MDGTSGVGGDFLYQGIRRAFYPQWWQSTNRGNFGLPSCGDFIPNYLSHGRASILRPPRHENSAVYFNFLDYFEYHLSNRPINGLENGCIWIGLGTIDSGGFGGGCSFGGYESSNAKIIRYDVCASDF